MVSSFSSGSPGRRARFAANQRHEPLFIQTKSGLSPRTRTNLIPSKERANGGEMHVTQLEPGAAVGVLPSFLLNPPASTFLQAMVRRDPALTANNMHFT